MARDNPYPVGTLGWKKWNTREWQGIPHPVKAKRKKRKYVPRPKKVKAKKNVGPDYTTTGKLRESVKLARSRDLWNATIDRLAEYGVEAWRLKNRVFIELEGHRGNQKRFHEYAGIKGAAEVTGLLPDGRRLDICCPYRTETSEDQDKFIRKINESGGVAFAIWSISQLDEKLQKLGYELRKNDEVEHEEEKSECGLGTSEVPAESVAGSGECTSEDFEPPPF